MGRRSKKGDGFIIMIVLIVAGYNWISNWVQSLNGDVVAKFALVIIVALIVVLLLKTLFDSWRDKIKAQSIEKDFLCFKNSIMPHVHVLARKKKQLIVKDDYGYTNNEPWEKEKGRFLKKLDYHPVTRRYYYGLTLSGYSNYIDAIVDEYVGENKAIQHLNYDDNITPAEYEILCADILESCGWKARVTKLSGDQGVDVIAEKDNFTIAIQCKKYSNPVGNKAVQEVTSGKVYYHADACAVVTNSTYTPAARSLAKSQGVLLLHHTDLYNLDEKIEGLAL
ncbi:restriction endonuclease [Cronobacter dublinensis]|uniref:restriction endonuclease n=1 Tax=Cronobacter dublinensis TaxID=413497 RepID=UPI0024C360EF|nr:restriction endonuclease [Cronobacter dublinensis]MDK1195295.1 restriction endonuclease [Cronobacter dublinensis]MDK1200438.1 restriction endonuclease [Cronobacter dublinensis]